MNKPTKARRKMLKAVAQVHYCVNVLNERGTSDAARAAKRAASYNYWKDREAGAQPAALPALPAQSAPDEHIGF